MRPADRKTMQYKIDAPAGSNTPNTSVRISSNNPKRRLLMIQNVGANDGLFHFGEPVQGDGSDMLFTTGSGLLFDRSETCPEAALNVGSASGTTFLIIEQVEQ